MRGFDQQCTRARLLLGCCCVKGLANTDSSGCVMLLALRQTAFCRSDRVFETGLKVTPFRRAVIGD